MLKLGMVQNSVTNLYELWQDSQVLRFILVGVLNTAFGYGLYVLLIWIGIHYTLAVFLSTVMGVLFNYFTSSYLTFRKNISFSILPRFIFSYIFVYLINITIVKIVLCLGINAYAAGFIAIFPVVVITFYLQKKWVFQ